ncbi:MAG: hypothetical protein QOH81_452 [Sphingomonadales bacterium]|jgi:uncharacterized protein (DUF2147 family)|nr:hypothetical protein [Sphingomonadales bacterium]
MNMIATLAPDTARPAAAVPADLALAYLRAAPAAAEPPSASAAPSPETDAISETAALTREEWTSVLLSVRDDRRSLRAVRARGRLGRFFFGNRRSPHLTSERLEALRRYAVLHRLDGGRLSAEEDQRLRRAGFSELQAGAVRAIVETFEAPARAAGAARSGRGVTAALLALSALLVTFIDRWLARQLDDSLGALLLSILMTISLVSFLSIAGHPHGRRGPAVRRSGPKRSGTAWRTIALAALAGSALLRPAPAAAAAVEGVWQNRNGTVEVQVAPCGPLYCGTVIAARGDAIADARKGGAARLVGTRVLKDYAPAADGSWRGSVFVPELGRHLSSKLSFVDADTVLISGCALGGLICKTKTWRRLSPHVERASLTFRK